MNGHHQEQTGWSGSCQKGISQHLDDSHDYVCLNFGGNLAAAMFVRNRGCDVVGCSFQFSRFSGLDFVAKKSSLTIGNGRKARRGCAALFGSCLDNHTGKTCLLQLATDQGRIMVAVRRACQKARRIVRKNLCGAFVTSSAKTFSSM